MKILEKISKILTNETDTQQLAEQLAKLNIIGSVWLSGDLGAGKTTLTRYWLQALGHQGSVKSPTYTLVEPYQILQSNGQTKPVYHADLYRLQDQEELEFIGFYEYQDETDALVIIEWASRAEELLANPVLIINIYRQNDDSRLVEIGLTETGKQANINIQLINHA